MNKLEKALEEVEEEVVLGLFCVLPALVLHCMREFESSSIQEKPAHLLFMSWSAAIFEKINQAYQDKFNLIPKKCEESEKGEESE